MTQPWIKPSSDDVQQYMSSFVVAASNEEDEVGRERLDGLLAKTVARVRAAVASSGRVPLSLTAGSVPPQAEQHVYVMVVAALGASSPQLASYIESDAFKRMLDAAQDWLEGANEGLNASAPADPDPATVGPGPSFGFATVEVDLSTDP